MQEKKQNNSPIKLRISQYVDTLDISKRDFYTKTGISRGTLENSAGITEDTLVKFIVAYPEVSIMWLITGEGSMIVDNVQQVQVGSDQVHEVIAAKNEIISTKEEIIEAMRKYIASLERIVSSR